MDSDYEKPFFRFCCWLSTLFLNQGNILQPVASSTLRTSWVKDCYFCCECGWMLLLMLHKYCLMSFALIIRNFSQSTLMMGSEKKSFRFLWLVSLNMRKKRSQISFLYGAIISETIGINFFCQTMRCELTMSRTAIWLRSLAESSLGTSRALQNRRPCMLKFLSRIPSYISSERASFFKYRLNIRMSGFQSKSLRWLVDTASSFTSPFACIV